MDASRESGGKYMRRALELARKGWGTTHPNPMVGAVIADQGEIVSEGWHQAAGKPHAEVNALRQVEERNLLLSNESVLYVTLEPCSTAGRTPPCTQAIFRAGLRKVVIGARDPNPRHAGRGISLLSKAGVEVETGVLEEECEDLNLIYNYWVTRNSPLIAGKTASTLDGRAATRAGESKWITGESARADVMRWRRYFPAIAAGAGTVLADNPRLTSRLEDEEWCPIRFVIDGGLRTAREPLPDLYTDEFREKTVVAALEEAPEEGKTRLRNNGIEIWELPADGNGLSWAAFRGRCREEGVTGVYCEGGPALLSSLLNARQLDYLFAYRAPKIFGDEQARAVFTGRQNKKINEAVRLADARHAQFGGDQLLRGHVMYPD